MKILSYHPLTKAQTDKIKSLGDIDLTILSAGEDPIPLLKNTEIYFSEFRFTHDLLQAAPKLKWLQVSSAGVNNVPLKELEQRKVLLTNVRGMHGDCISEYVLAMMFALNRKLPYVLKNQQASKWQKFGQSMLKDKTLGIIGLGGIGQVLATKASALGLHVIGLRNSNKAAEHVERIYQHDSLNDFMAASDYVAVCCPLTPETTGLVSAAAIAAMKPTASLINIARGPVVDEEALIAALQNKRIASAALDVFQVEPLPVSSPLWQLDNVILTPHVAGDMEDYSERAAAIFVENVEHYMKHELLRGLVDYKLGY